MNTTSAKRDQIVASLSDKEYRDAFVAAEIETTIPFQLRAMRKARGWKQKQLAAAAGMTQARISVLESPDYEGAVNVKTLEKLAAALDVGLIVRFAPFSEVVDWTIGISAKWGHNVPEYSKDEGLQASVVHITDAAISSTATASIPAFPNGFSLAVLGVNVVDADTSVAPQNCSAMVQLQPQATIAQLAHAA